jgi:hypothetical protein
VEEKLLEEMSLFFTTHTEEEVKLLLPILLELRDLNGTVLPLSP